MRIKRSAVAIISGLSVFWALALVSTSDAAAAADPFEILNAIPALPANVAAAGAATQVTAGGDHGPFTAPAYDAVALRITTALRPAAASSGGIDFSKAASDPAYAAQMQARMQNMSMAEKMAMANQMMAAQQAAAGDPRSTGQIVAFLGSQRPADIVAQQKIHTLLEAALESASARHRAVDSAMSAAAKACPTDKTGWPLHTCTDPLGSKSLAQHRAAEDASLGNEVRALAEARAIALAELNKGRDLFAHGGSANPSLTAWALVYVQMLDDYARTVTLRAGFWSHADGSKYTGEVANFIRTPGGEISWPLKAP